MMIHATFIMEQHLGHQVYCQNLRHVIDQNAQVCATWVPVTYAGESLWEHIPLLPSAIRGPLTGRHQVQQGLLIEPCDILYFNTQVPAVLRDPRPIGKPYIVATDITPIQLDQMAAAYNHRVDRRGPIHWMKYHATRRAFQGAARLLPWSSWTGESLIKDYTIDPEKVEVLPPGVDLEWWHPARSVESRLPRILFVGGDFARKGGNLLLEAFRSLPSGLAELILVTRSPVTGAEGITIHGNIQPNSPELRMLYQTSDIFVLPSTAEAFGIAAVEASAAGLPVIAATTGGLADIVVDQVTGFLIPPGDVEALAVSLRALLENPGLRQSMGMAGIQRAKQYFDARKNAARIVEIMAEVTSQRETRP